MLWCAVSEAEWRIVDQLRQREGCASIADLLILALNNLLDESGDPVLLTTRRKGRPTTRDGDAPGTARPR